MKTMSDQFYRTALNEDAAAVFVLLEKVANEIPVLLDTEQRKAAIQECTRKCCANNESLVAVNSEYQIVGFLLIEPDSYQRFQYENEALHLKYGGVLHCYRGHHIFPELLRMATARGVPLTATVKHANTSNMADRLLRFGFVRSAETMEQVDLIWTPVVLSN